MKGDICRIDDCQTLVVGQGRVCSWHRYAKRKYGSFDVPRNPRGGCCHSTSRIHDALNTRKNLFYHQSQLPDENGCMKWRGSKNRKGYGTIYWNNRRMQLAPRVSYAIHFGEFDQKLCVLHRCDNPSCVAPGHLFLGTRKDNMRDCSDKKRLKIPQIKGGACWNAKLNEEKVKHIKECLRNGTSAKELSSLYGVHTDTIYAIKTEKNWSHVQ